MTPIRALTWAVIVLGTVYLTVAGGGGFFGLYELPMRVGSVAAAVIVLVAWMVVATRDPAWRPRSSLWPAIVACLSAMAITTAAGVTPRVGYDYLAYAILLAGLYLLLVRLFAHPIFGPRLGMLALILGFGLAGIYDLVILKHWIDFWATLGRFSTPPLRPDYEGLAYGNPSTIATVVVLLWLASAAHLGFAGRRRVTALSILAVLTASVVFLSGSRGAWVGLGLTAVLLLVLWISRRPNRERFGRLAMRRDVRLVGAAAGVAAVAIGAILGPALASRVTEGGVDTRAAFYAAAVRMFADRPVTGVGPGGWVVERARFTVAPEPDYYIPHAHNIWLQTLAELGIVGAVAGVIAIVSVALLLRRGARSPAPLDRRLAWAALAGAVYLGAHQLVDFYPNMPAVGFCFALVVARLDARLEPTAPVVSSGPRRAIGLLLVLGLVAAVGWLARSEMAAWSEQRAAEAANRGDWAISGALARAANDLDPGFSPSLFTAGLAAAHLGDTGIAREYLARSARMDDLPTTWLDVAQLSVTLGDRSGARDALARAMRLGYQNPQVALGAATVYSALGDRPSAVDALASALIAAPGLASDPYFKGPMASVFAEASSRAAAAAPPGIGYVIALESGRVDAARAIASALTGDEGKVSNLAVDAWAGDAAAFAELHAIGRADPLHDEVVGLCRRIAAHTRDPGWSAAAWSCDGAGAPASLLVVRVSSPPAARVVLPGPNAPWHFQYVYRRVTPWDELVPGLPHLAVVFV